MLGKNWHTSPREYGITIERGVRIPVAKGITLDCDLFRPDAPGKFPLILAVHPYLQPAQSMQIVPEGNSYRRAFMEAGDYNFYVRRGYAFAIVSIRGAQGSDGFIGNLNPDNRTVDDIVQAIAWFARQRWCDGNVGMFGVSYFSVMQKRVAMRRPPALKCIFAPYGWTEAYRDLYYHGGLFAHGFVAHWAVNRAIGLKVENAEKKRLGAKKYADAVAALRRDPELTLVPIIAQALNNPDAGTNALLIEILLHNLYDDYHKERTVTYERSDLPAYLGADWGLYGFHLPGDLRAWANWKGPKRLTIGPPIYLDRPLYQYAYESLRWFDHWLKGNDTGMLEEKPVKLFIVGANEWKEADEWPLPETRWTPFYLHRGGLLSEHEFWPSEGGTTWEDSPFFHGEAVWMTPPLVDNIEICGPMALNLWASSTDTEALFFASLIHVKADGTRELLTRGWLRGSQRRLDRRASRPWGPVQTHEKREPLKPGEPTEFAIAINAYGVQVKAGERLALRLKSADDEKPNSTSEVSSMGHLWRRAASHVTVHHDAEHPSHLLLPVTKGNVLGTFISGGKLPGEG
jgi:predicted acyl esterase